jgi:hypothetical protein
VVAAWHWRASSVPCLRVEAEVAFTGGEMFHLLVLLMNGPACAALGCGARRGPARID